MNSDDLPANEERLAAWLDGELDKDGTEAMSELVSTDEALMRRAERLTRLDELVRAAVPEETVPAALLARLGLAPAVPQTSATVLDFAAAQRDRIAGQTGTDGAGYATPPQRGKLWQAALWRIAAQVLVVGGVGIGAALWLAPQDTRPAQGQSAPEAAYRTLSNRPAAAASPVNAVVAFGDAVDPASARRIAGAAGASLMGEPNEAGAWKASIAPAQRDTVLKALREDRRVTLAEAIDGADR